MNKQELIEKIKANGEWFETNRYVKITKVIELVNQIDEPQNEKHLHDIKNQIEYLLDHGPGKNKSLRMLENMVDNMLTGYWSLSGEKSVDGTWREAIQVLEHHFQCEIPRNLDQVIEGFNSMSGLLNSVEFELDKQGSKLTSKEFVLEALERYKQKVKVPAFVAEWFEENKQNLEYRIWKYIKNWDDKEQDDFKDWMNTDGCSLEILTRMKYGYEVEEEPKYYIELPGTTWGTYLVKSDDNDLLVWQNTKQGTPFTEHEIKAIDERYWLFKVPVEKV